MMCCAGETKAPTMLFVANVEVFTIAKVMFLNLLILAPYNSLARTRAFQSNVHRRMLSNDGDRTASYGVSSQKVHHTERPS